MAGQATGIGAFDELKRLIRNHTFACDDILTDIKADAPKALYNIDFSVLHPLLSSNILRGRAPTDAGNNDALAYETLTLAPAYKNILGVQFVMSFPAYLELLDHVDRRLSQLGTLKEDTNKSRKLFDELSAYRKEVELGRIEEKDLIGSHDLRGRLRSLINNLPNVTEARNLANVLALVEQKVLCGLGDYFSKEQIEGARNGRRYYKEVLQRIDRYRGQKIDGADRDPTNEDAEFHRKIDAWSVTLSRQLHTLRNDQSVLFLGPDRLRYVYENDRSELSRNIIAPFLRLKTLSMAAASQNVDNESRHWLEKLARRLSEAWGLIERANSPDDLYTSQVDTVREAQSLIAKVYTAEPGEVRAGEESRRAVIAQLLKNPRSLRDKAGEVEEEMKSAVHKMLSLAPEPLNESVLEAYDIKDNRRMRQLMKKYNAV